MTEHLHRLIGALSDPAIYPHGPESVDVIQTHISAVFLADDLVYKIKKPLDLGFLDFTDLEKRKYYCGREVELNSRYSEGIYLEVVSISEGESGINLHGEGDVVEYAVLMNRIPEQVVLKNKLHNEDVAVDLLDSVAERIAYFHGVAKTDSRIAAFGAIEVIRHNVEENIHQIRPYIGRTVSREDHEDTAELSLEFLAAHRDLFRSRVARGRIKDCHGDLHLMHILAYDPIMLCDCIEFNDRFRYGDTASDLGFLLMDLAFNGFPAYGERIREIYRQAAHDDELDGVLDFYQSYRAFVRGKVTSFALDDPEISEQERIDSERRAEDYLLLSKAFLSPSPPSLIIMCGLSGTGKSYLAERLGGRLGTRPMRSDIVRKELHGVPPSEHHLDNSGGGIYTTNATEATYTVLLDSARRRLEQGLYAIVDASFLDSEYRERARNLAERLNVRFRIVRCSAPEDTVRTRLEQRAQSGTDPSDATWDVYLGQRERSDEITTDERPYLKQWDSTTDVNAFLTTFVRDLLIGR